MSRAASSMPPVEAATSREALWKPCAFARPESPNSGPDRRDTSAATRASTRIGVAPHPGEVLADPHEPVVAHLLDLVLRVASRYRQRR